MASLDFIWECEEGQGRRPVRLLCHGMTVAEVRPCGTAAQHAVATRIGDAQVGPPLDYDSMEVAIHATRTWAIQNEAWLRDAALVHAASAGRRPA